MFLSRRLSVRMDYIPRWSKGGKKNIWTILRKFLEVLVEKPEISEMNVPESAEYSRIQTTERKKNKERDTRMRKMESRTAMRTLPKMDVIVNFESFYLHLVIKVILGRFSPPGRQYTKIFISIL